MKNQICKNCTYYSAYYKQWSNGYGRLSNGFCSRNNKPQTQFEACEGYKSNEQKEEMRQIRMIKSLEQALTSINDIVQILKEKENDRKASG